MDILQSLFTVLEGVIAAAGRVVQALAGVFSVNVSAGQAQSFVVLVIVAWLVRIIFWPIASAKTFKPQTIILKTDKTPWQVVTEDVNGCLTGIAITLWFVVFLLLWARAGF